MKIEEDDYIEHMTTL